MKNCYTLLCRFWKFGKELNGSWNFFPKFSFFFMNFCGYVCECWGLMGLSTNWSWGVTISKNMPLNCVCVWHFLSLILLCFVCLGVLLWNRTRILKMNCYSLQQNAFAACEEMRGSVVSVNLVTDQKEPVICPKPRRVGVLSNMAMRPLRLHFK